MVIALNGGIVTLAIMMSLFFLVQIFVVIMALSLDNSRYSLVIYSPLLAIGYRQVLDTITILALLNFAISGLKRENVEWKRVERVGGIQPVMKVNA